MGNVAFKVVVESVRQDGRPFRPSDWIERLSCTMGTFGRDHRLHYAKSVQPAFVNGDKCLVVDEALKSENPGAYAFIMGFADSNLLRRHVEPSSGG